MNYEVDYPGRFPECVQTPEGFHTVDSLLELPLYQDANGQDVPVRQAAERFLAEWGEEMSGQTIRFGRWFGLEGFSRNEYGTTDPHQTAVEDFVRQKIGPDVDPTLHMTHMLRYFAAFLNYERGEHGTNEFVRDMSEEQIARLAFIFLTHDTGEYNGKRLNGTGIPGVGDIISGEKTDEDRANEKAVRQFVNEQCFEDVPEEIRRIAELVISHDAAATPRHLLRADEQTAPDLHDVYEFVHSLASIDTTLRTEAFDDATIDKLVHDRAVAEQIKHGMNYVHAQVAIDQSDILQGVDNRPGFERGVPHVNRLRQYGYAAHVATCIRLSERAEERRSQLAA